MPKDVCERIESELNIGDIYSIGPVIHGTVLAIVMILLRKGDKIRDPDINELYMRFATLAMLRIRAEGDPNE